MATVDRQQIAPRTMKSDNTSADNLGIANTVGILVLGFAMTALIFLFLDSTLRSSANQEESLRFVRALDLNSLSLIPAGRPRRNPGAINRPIDLAFDPNIGPLHIDSVDLVLKAPD